MSDRPLLGPLLLAMALALLAPRAQAQSATPAKERWMLMARHGECAPVSSLKRKVPDLGEIADPQGFAEFMRRKGLEVRAVQRSLPKGQYWEVSVPAYELGLVFVTQELCQAQR
jgi:hypothetical protein